MEGRRRDVPAWVGLALIPALNVVLANISDAASKLLVPYFDKGF